MTQTIIAPSGLTFKPPGTSWAPGPLIRSRWWIVSKWRSGKTAFAASIPGALHIDIEKKLHLVRDTKATTVTVDSFQKFEALIAWLVKDAAKTFQFIIIDTVDELRDSLVIPGMTATLPSRWLQENPYCDITEHSKSKEGGGGWSRVTNKILGYFRQVHLAGYGWMAIGHQKEHEGRVRPAINQGISGGIYRMAEYAARTSIRQVPGTRTVTINGKQKEIKDPSATALIGQLDVTSKVSDSEVRLGSNLALPSPIVIPHMMGWPAVEKVYATVTGEGE